MNIQFFWALGELRPAGVLASALQEKGPGLWYTSHGDSGGRSVPPSTSAGLPVLSVSSVTLLSWRTGFEASLILSDHFGHHLKGTDPSGRF